MKSTFYLYFVILSALSLSACSMIPGTNSYAEKNNPVLKLEPLKAIKTSLKTTAVWNINTANISGENKIHPFIDSTTVFVAGSGSVSAWHAITGKPVWKTNIGETITAGVNGTLLANPQSRSTIKSTADQIFIGTNSGNAIAINAKTGTIQWIERLSSEVLSVSPSDKGRVAFRTADGKLHGLTSKTGELMWQQSQSTPPLSQLGAGAPIIASNLIIAGFDNGKVVAYDLQSGDPLWEIPLSSSNANSDQILDVDGKLHAMGNALFASSLNGSLMGINMEHGKQVWVKPFSSSVGVNGSALGLFSTEKSGKIWAFDPQSGNPIWSLDVLEGRQPSVPMLINGKTLVVSDTTGDIHFINAANGKFSARIKGDPKGYAVAPAISSNTVYLFGKSGVLSKISL